MNTNNKEKLLHYYKELIKKEINNTKNQTNKEIVKLINQSIKSTKLTRKDYKNIQKQIIKETKNNKYILHVNQIENIINILQLKHHNIKIECKTQDIEPAIYYHHNNNFYLINYDSIENKWYLSLIEEKSLDLIKEIYNDSYKEFVDFLKYKSH